MATLGRGLAAVVLTGCWLAPAAAAAGTPDSRLYACRDGTVFSVTVTGRTAAVEISKSERYRLRAKPSTLGQRFASASATLIIDGRFAALVTRERTGLGGCFLAQPTASADPDAKP